MSARSLIFLLIRSFFCRIDKKFFRPGDPIRRWAIVIFETAQKFSRDLDHCIQSLVDGCKEVGRFFLSCFFEYSS